MQPLGAALANLLAFDTPVAREILGSIGLYARRGSADDLAAKLELALDDAELARQRGAAGRARTLADFSWERAIGQVEAIYAQVLGTAARPYRVAPR